MRVAALLPAATDIVIALGAGDQLVAVTHACVLPRAFSGTPRVTRSRVAGGTASDVDTRVSDLASAGAPMFDIDEPLLARQHPDVILTQAVCEVCAVREADARAVAARLEPPARVAALGARTVEGILADVMTVAGALEVTADGEELVLGLRSRMAAVHRKLKAAKAPRPGVAVLEWIEPAFNAGHWAPDAVRRAGGEELFGETGELSRRLTFDELNGRDPAVVIVAPCGYTLGQTVVELEQQRNSAMTGWLRGKGAWIVDANRLLSSPGPNVVRGIEVLASILHPGLFGAPSPRDAVQISR